MRRTPEERLKNEAVAVEAASKHLEYATGRRDATIRELLGKGEHTQEELAELAGVSDRRIRQIRDEGVTNDRNGSS